MRSVAQAGLAAVLFTGFFSPISAKQLTPEQVQALEAIKADPEAQQQALSQLSSKSGGQPNSARKGKTKDVTQASKDGASSSTAKQPDAITQLIQNNRNKPPSEREYSPCPGWIFILRQNWKDLGNVAGAACPDSVENAQGAQISFADDLAGRNRVVTVNGTAAVIYNSVTGDVPAPTPYAVSFGAYTTVNDISNSADSQMKSNAESLAYGGLVNLGFLDSSSSNYFTLRAGMTEDYVKNTTASSAVLDWSPVFGPLYIHYPYHFSSIGIPVITRFDPDLVARFDGATGKGQILAFNNMPDSLRLGPELALTIYPDIGYVSGPLLRLSALFGYDIWYETYSGKRISWFTSSIKYNLDEAGNFAIKGTYSSGQDETTGKSANIYTIGLSGKI